MTDTPTPDDLAAETRRGILRLVDAIADGLDVDRPTFIRRLNQAATQPITSPLSIVDLGIPLIASSTCPPPRRCTPGEEGRRIVRHGMADILAWLGEKPGPRPDDLIHTTLVIDGAIHAHPDTIAVIREAAS